MKLPHTRSSIHRARHGRRLFTLVTAALVAAFLGAGVFLAARSRSPILPIVETTGSIDAIELWRSGEYDRVVQVTSEHLERYPLDETSLTLRGFTRFYLAMEAVESEQRQHLLVQSVQDLRRALLLPDVAMEPQIRYVLGKAYYHRGRFFFDSAIRELDYALQHGVGQLDLLEYLALAHTSLNNTAEAIHFFREAIRVGGEDVHRVRLADVLISVDEYADADTLLQGVIDGNGDILLHQHALLSLGKSLRRQERFEDSLSVFRELLQVNANSAEGRYQLGETYLAMGERDRARFEWREALRLNPNHIESFQRLQEY